MSGGSVKELEGLAGPATVEGPEWLEPVRRAAMERFARTGLPSAREEEWRFTPVTPIAQGTWQPAWTREPAAPAVSRDQVAQFVFGHEEWATLVFVNGEFAPELSTMAARALRPTTMRLRECVTVSAASAVVRNTRLSGADSSTPAGTWR